MLSAHGDATRAVAAAARADMVQTVECAETEAEATVYAVTEHTRTFNAEQMEIIDFFDSELVKLAKQVESAERARADANHLSRSLAQTLEAVQTVGRGVEEGIPAPGRS